ncbi:MAG: MOSC domain-containing protein, partial [Chloroflexota bacterium]|nr:MOSC domain-containing protein [Chloroflexota bacterium]
TNLAGDGQADLVNHGGADKAVCCYPAGHYADWHRELGLDPAAFPYGAFGENLTLSGVTETTVCLGDTFTVGTATVQVSQPRQPCWKLSRRWGVRDLAARVQRTKRTGWYVRVVEEGDVAAGQALTLVDRPVPDWTVERVTGVIYAANDIAGAAELAECDLLAGSLRAYMAERVHDAKASAPT